MSWKRPHHMRWLCACGLALLLTGYFGGFSLSAGAVFLAVFAVGAVLLGLDEPEVAEPDHDYDLGDDDSGVEFADEPEESEIPEPSESPELPEAPESPELSEPPESPELPESPGTPVAT